MSLYFQKMIIFRSNNGIYICHENSINKNYEKLGFRIKKQLFDICTPYKIQKTKKLETDENREIKHVKTCYEIFLQELRENNFLDPKSLIKNNKLALDCSDNVYKETSEKIVQNAVGQNLGPPKCQPINGINFLFPENCKFFSKDIQEISQNLKTEKFDLIVLDPPWWNKYIRRKRKKSDHAYNMMYNNDLKNIPIEMFLKNSGLIVVWCTNSTQHLKNLKEEIFPKWKVNFLTKLYWLKITKSGEIVCPFSPPPGKQPFEQIIIAGRNIELAEDLKEKIIVSVPSAIHSHKPPLNDILKPYLPENPDCLEIFARYLLPEWTSYGNEVLKLQHESVFEKF